MLDKRINEVMTETIIFSVRYGIVRVLDKHKYQYMHY